VISWACLDSVLSHFLSVPQNTLLSQEGQVGTLVRAQPTVQVRYPLSESWTRRRDGGRERTAPRPSPAPRPLTLPRRWKWERGGPWCGCLRYSSSSPWPFSRRGSKTTAPSWRYVSRDSSGFFSVSSLMTDPPGLRAGRASVAGHRSPRRPGPQAWQQHTRGLVTRVLGARDPGSNPGRPTIICLYS